MLSATVFVFRMNPLVTAIVLNYRTPQEAVRCVFALQKQTIADRMEIIVVDNHSEDDSIGILRNRLGKLPHVVILETPDNLGFGRGYNLGLHRAQGEFILLNNPAKILAPDAVECMADAMKQDPTIGILGPKLVYNDGTIRDSYRSFPKPMDVVLKRTPLRRFFSERMRRYLQWDRDPEQVGDTDWVIGGCLMIRRDLCEQLHGFDPRFFLFFEDMDLCRRCWTLGKRVVYFPQAVASDRKSRLSEGGIFSLIGKKVGREHIASAVKYFWKWRNEDLGTRT